MLPSNTKSISIASWRWTSKVLTLLIISLIGRLLSQFINSYLYISFLHQPFNYLYMCKLYFYVSNINRISILFYNKMGKIASLILYLQKNNARKLYFLIKKIIES